jgi:hypothetical protein
MVTRTIRATRFALAAAAGMACLFITDSLSSDRQSSLITQADARVGRPLTPGSVAGVGRRMDRRAYGRGAVVGGAALGAGAAALGAGAYYGGYGGYAPYGNSYDAYTYGNEDNEAVYGGSGGDDGGIAYCTQRYRSYDPSSGTYLGYDGQRHGCP